MKQLLIAFDQLVNCCVWSEAEGLGSADETLSARTWRLARRYPTTWGRFERVVDTAFFWQDGHCYLSYLAEKERRHLPKEYRRA